jgi:hypothetical protein
MHTTMIFVPEEKMWPDLGELVDVQQPLTYVSPDRIVIRGPIGL